LTNIVILIKLIYMNRQANSKMSIYFLTVLLKKGVGLAYV